MMKKAKIFVLILLMFSCVGLTFLPASSGYAACPDRITSYWKLDEATPGDPGGTYTDFVNDNDGTGAANPTAVAGRVNGAQQFDNLDGIDVLPDRSFDWYNDESFSIEFWIRRKGAVVGNQVAIGRDDGNPLTSLHWWVGIDNVTNTANFTLGDNNGGADQREIKGNKDLTDDVWHHVVAVRDADAGAAGQNLLYVDGKLDTPAVDQAYDAGFNSISAVLTIGYLAGAFRFEGMLDEVALYDRALTEAEIQDHYDDGRLAGQDYCLGSVPSDAPFPDDTISLWKLNEANGPTYEDSFDDNDGTGAADPDAVAGIVNGAQQFDNLDGIDVLPDRSFDWTNDESFSIEFWIRRKGAVVGNQVAIGRDDGNPLTSLHWWVGIDNVTDTANFTLGDNNGGADQREIKGNKDLTDDAWHHVVAVRDADAGAAGQNLLYVDGVLDTPAVDQAYDMGFGSISAVLTIGYLDGGSRFEGMLDEIALYDRALTEAEIQEHYDDGLAGQGIDFVPAAAKSGGGGGGGGGGCFISTAAK